MFLSLIRVTGWRPVTKKKLDLSFGTSFILSRIVFFVN
ncbi:hypothetical protein SSUST1_1821 [Streptococcus suis ST1]|nr:hypothetical protein SSUST1_1821 [Streptococcus suis ST1]